MNLVRLRWSAAVGAIVIAACGGAPGSDAGVDDDGPLPRVVWRPEVPPTCPAASVGPFRPTPSVGVIGRPRWTRTLADLGDESAALTGLFNGDFPLGAGMTPRGAAIWGFRDGTLLSLGFESGALILADGFSPASDPSTVMRMWFPDSTIYVTLDEAPGGLIGAGICEEPSDCPPDVNRLRPEPRGLRDELPYEDARSLGAWSPVTRDVVIRWGNRVVYGGCLDGQPRFAALFDTILGDGLFVRANGEIVVTGFTTHVLGPDGEPRREVDLAVDGQSITGTYTEGCGVMFNRTYNRMWQWLNVDTMELGPMLRLPDELSAFAGAWSGTPDCGVIVHTDALSGQRLIRLGPDGSVVFNIDAPGVAAPFVLADGGFLTVLYDQYEVFAADGSLREHVGFDASFVGPCWPQSSMLAPDGTLFLACGDAEAGELGTLAFHAVPTGYPAGPDLSAHGGLNFAGTNSILPD